MPVTSLVRRLALQLVPTDVRHLHLRLHLPGAAGLTGALLGVAVTATSPDDADLLAEILVGGAGTQ